jgi:hypothetical protein
MAVDVVEGRREPQREVRRGAHDSEWMHSMSTGGDEAAAFWAGARIAVAVSAMLWLAGAVAVLLLVRAL